MKKRMVLPVILASAFIMPSAAYASQCKIDSVKTYNVSVPDKLKVPFTGSGFANGLVTGYGSGVTFKGYDGDNLQFYAVTDRGPNADAPKYVKDGKTSDAKIFPCPSFTPSIGVISVSKTDAKAVSAIDITDGGKKITGLPIAPGNIGSTNEAALDMSFNDIGYDSNGLDTEGIATDKDGNFWLCDEYGPFIVKADSTGKILEKYGPGEGLDDILKYRIPNRGFEGITVTPSGKVIAAVQSVLDVDGKTSKTACFTRLVEFDPQTKKTKMFAYPVDVSQYKSPKDCKIGDIYAVNDNLLLVIEQGTLKDKTMSNVIYKADLSKATDISKMTYNGEALEYAKNADELSGICFVSKEKYIDLRQNGWTSEKAEGICLLDDKKTIAVTNDNDFGITTKTSDGANKGLDITDYTYDSGSKKFTYKGAQAKPEISIAEKAEPAQLWLFKADKAADEEPVDGFIKLRDAAAALKGTENEFSVEFDASKKCVYIKTKASYEKIGNENIQMPFVPSGKSDSGWNLCINGAKTDIQSENIAGNNCFMLSDLEKILSCTLR